MTPFTDTHRYHYFIPFISSKLIRSDPTEGLQRTQQAETQLPLPAEVPLKPQP